uniref:Uncharacterized protein n=1 Tax=Ditylenchus dipsaci TaxID=166011 RepID=A0A915DPW7_9BILA
MCTDTKRVRTQFWTNICKTAKTVFEDSQLSVCYRVKLVTCEYCFPQQELELFELVKNNERLVHTLIQEGEESKSYLLERF